MKLRIAFRVDASLEIGTGHVMRCLTLADALRDKNAEVFFLCRPHTGHLIATVRAKGYTTFVLRDPSSNSDSDSKLKHASWLGSTQLDDVAECVEVIKHNKVDLIIVDHYSLDHRWETQLRSKTERLMVIDDLADREHDCDLLLDQNLGRLARDYDDLVSSSTTLFIGPQFALLRPEFALLRPQSLARKTSNPQLKQLLITMGGVDKDNVTGQVLDALKVCGLPASLNVTVIVGAHCPWVEEVQSQSTQMPWQTQVLINADNMAMLMADSDIAIGAAGSTSWERCCLGLPTFQIALSQNQEPIANALSVAGAALTLPRQHIAQVLAHTMSSSTMPHRLKHITNICSAVTQGLGADIVSNHISGSCEDYIAM